MVCWHSSVAIGKVVYVVNITFSIKCIKIQQMKNRFYVPDQNRTKKKIEMDEELGQNIYKQRWDTKFSVTTEMSR